MAGVGETECWLGVGAKAKNKAVHGAM